MSRPPEDVAELLADAGHLWRYEEGRRHYLRALREVAGSAELGTVRTVARVVAHVLRCDLERGVTDMENGLAVEVDSAHRAELRLERDAMRLLIERCKLLEVASSPAARRSL